jgi:DNA/RNA endonuclease G (NUC1)
MKTKVKYLLIGLSTILFISAQSLKDIQVKNQVFSVTYSQSLEQPLELTYRSTNRPTNVNRGSMDFKTVPNIHTSNSEDYAKNVWDKGHLAPAATFSDNMENLSTTFSYLNCALQNQYLNRGEWRLLEEQERKWDDKENLTVKITLDFDKSCLVIPTGATVPKGFTKHIYFETTKRWECYYFLNERPEKKWNEHKIKCVH